MEYVNLGRTGLMVSRICLGCMTYGGPPAADGTVRSRHAWALDEADSQPFLRQALDLGINFFDTANVYSGGVSEEVVGRFLKANTRREAVVIATKVHGVMRDEPNGRGPVPQGHLLRAGREPAPPGHGLRGPVPDPPLGRPAPPSRRPWRRCTTW